jgi:hypothetical protein
VDYHRAREMVTERGTPTTITEGLFCYRVTIEINLWSHLSQICRCAQDIGWSSYDSKTPGLLPILTHDTCNMKRVSDLRIWLLLVPSFPPFQCPPPCFLALAPTACIGSKGRFLSWPTEPTVAFISDEGSIQEPMWS